jgi:hypothetical protein
VESRGGCGKYREILLIYPDRRSSRLHSCRIEDAPDTPTSENLSLPWWAPMANHDRGQF